MEQNFVYELARTLQQTSGLENDFSAMANTLKETLEKNYLQKIHHAAKSQKSLSVERPPKEVTLLRALSPFMDEAKQSQIQELTRTLLLLNTFQGINRNVTELTQESGLLAARSADCPESTLSPQMAQMTGLLMMLAICNDF